MSANLLAWFPFHALQWAGRLAHLNSAERGALLSVVIDSWNAELRGGEPGTFPDNPLAFERVIGKTWRRELQGVRQHFLPDPNNAGLLRCAWLVELHREQLDRHENYKKNGQKGGRPPKPGRSREAEGEKPGSPREQAGLKLGFSEEEAGPKPGGTEVELLEGKDLAAAGARVRVREGPESPDDGSDVLAPFDEPHRAVVARFLDAAPDGQRDSIARTLAGWLLGQGWAGGRAARQEDIATGLADYLAQSGERITFTPKGFRSFVEDAERRRTASVSGGGTRRLGPVGAEVAARATELHRLVIEAHLGSLNGIQFEQAIEQLLATGRVDERAVEEIRSLAPLSDFARARSEEEGRRLAIQRYEARMSRPQLAVIA